MSEYRNLPLWIVAGALLPVLGCGEGDDSPQEMTTLDPTTSTTTPVPGTSETGDSDDTQDTTEPACVPGTQNDCSCVGGLEGFQVCNSEGTGFGDCMCEPASDTEEPDETEGGGSSSTGPGEPCGNGTCEPDLDETCRTCEDDCGVCEPCDQAPSCEGAEIPPAIDTHAMFLDDPMAYVAPPEIIDDLTSAIETGGLGARLIAAALTEPQVDEPAFVGTLRAQFDQHPEATDAVRRQFGRFGMQDPAGYVAIHGAPALWELQSFAAGDQAASLPGVGGLTQDLDPMAAPCDDPRMRIRVATLTVHEEDDDFFNDEVYCAITSEAAEHAELKVTPLTTPLDEGDSVDYNLDAGLVWGQSELTAPMGNILLTYNCIESEGSGEGYANLLMGIGDAIGDADGKAVGVDGWVFPAAGVVTNLLAGALTLDGDDLLFNGSQTVQAIDMLPLTYGAWWSVRREGTNLNSDWDWELRMEIWGCHNFGTGGMPE